MTLTIIALVTGVAREIANRETFPVAALQSAVAVGASALHRARAGLAAHARLVTPPPAPQ